MITEETKKKVLDKVRNLSAEELVARFKKLGSTRLNDDGFDLKKFLADEEERLCGGWIHIETFKMEIVRVGGADWIHQSDNSPDGLAA